MTYTFVCRCLRVVAPIVLALTLVALMEAAVWACPGCKEGLAANDPQHERAVRGYFWSIIFMLSMPPAIIATLGSYFYIEVRRARADKARMESQKSEVGSQK